MGIGEERSNLAGWIESIVRDFCRDSADNSLENGTGEPAWEEPLVGFSRADDPLFEQFQRDIGPFHWTPVEAFDQVHAEAGAHADELTVVSYILPQTGATRADQSRESSLPAERWVRSRHFGEMFNERLRDHLVEALATKGIPAVAPARSPDFAYRVSERFGLASNWSERHVAHASGLGTFGLSDGLITRRGKAMRCGSVVARVSLPPTQRPYADPRAWCLFYARGTCGICARRCPVEAIGPAGHDKVRCHDYIRRVTARHARERFGIDATPCGLCQVAIPCESRNPVRD